MLRCDALGNVVSCYVALCCDAWRCDVLCCVVGGFNTEGCEKVRYLFIGQANEETASK